MMYRCGWAEQDEHQSRVLAVWVKRSFFDRIVEVAVPSTPGEFDGEPDAWKQALADSSVRVQWNPDRAPGGNRWRVEPSNSAFEARSSGNTQGS